MSNYDFDFNLQENDTNTYISYKVDEGTTVLEFGPANGRLTKYLARQKKCTVDIVEIDEEAGKEASQFARISLIGAKEGNIENLKWRASLEKNRYDYIIFADVLEHLTNPEEVLKASKDLLNDEGEILISVPNICHNAIVSQLLNDKFEYKKTGLLDQTHIHFFTPKSIVELIENVGMYVLDTQYVILDNDETEFDSRFEEMDFASRQVLFEHNLGNVYETIINAGLKRTVRNAWKINERTQHNVFSRIFWRKDGEDFSENNCKVFYIRQHEVFIDFEIPFDTVEIRVDPLNIPGILVDVDSNFKPNNNEPWICNGYELAPRELLFTNSTSQILFKTSNSNSQFYFKAAISSIDDAIIRTNDLIRTKYIENQELQTENQELQTENQELQTKNQELQTKNQELQSIKLDNEEKITQANIAIKELTDKVAVYESSFVYRVVQKFKKKK